MVSIVELNNCEKILDVIMNFMAFTILSDIDEIFMTAFISPEWNALAEMEIPITRFKGNKIIIHNEFVVLKSVFDENKDKLEPLVDVEEGT